MDGDNFVGSGFMGKDSGSRMGIPHGELKETEIKANLKPMTFQNRTKIYRLPRQNSAAVGFPRGGVSRGGRIPKHLTNHYFGYQMRIIYGVDLPPEGFY